MLLFESLSLPGVRLSAQTAVPIIPEIAARVPEFWVVWPKSRLVLESSFDGTLHLARIPPR